MSDMSGDGGDWCSVSEAARRLGITRSAIYSRINRKTLDAMDDNHGRPLVRVSVSGGCQLTGGSLRKLTGVTVTDSATEPRRLIQDGVIHDAALAALQQTHGAALAALQGQVDQLRTGLDSERRRHDAEIERLIGQVHAERSFWVERADRAEMVAEQALAHAADAQRRMADLVELLTQPLHQSHPPAPTRPERDPWWRRWLGASKRSDIGG